MSSKKLNETAKAYMKARKPAGVAPETEEEEEVTLLSEPKGKRSKKLEFTGSEGHTMNTYDMRKKSK